MVHDVPTYQCLLEKNKTGESPGTKTKHQRQKKRDKKKIYVKIITTERKRLSLVFIIGFRITHKFDTQRYEVNRMAGF